jgi:hypothetical protein
LDERTLESQHPTYLRSLLGKNAAKIKHLQENYKGLNPSEIVWMFKDASDINL